MLTGGCDNDCNYRSLFITGMLPVILDSRPAGMIYKSGRFFYVEYLVWHIGILWFFLCVYGESLTIIREMI